MLTFFPEHEITETFRARNVAADLAFTASRQTAGECSTAVNRTLLS